MDARVVVGVQDPADLQLLLQVGFKLGIEEFHDGLVAEGESREMAWPLEKWGFRYSPLQKFKMSLVIDSHRAGFFHLPSVHLQSHLAGHLLDSHMNQSYAYLCTFALECSFLSSYHNAALPDPRAQLNAHLLHTAFPDYAKIPSVLCWVPSGGRDLSLTLLLGIPSAHSGFRSVLQGSVAFPTWLP